MSKNESAVIILAAGKGTRMRSDIPKVLHEVAGKPLIKYVVETAFAISPSKVVVVVGYGADRVKESLKGEPVLFALQEEQLGTAHAVMCARSALAGFTGEVVVLCGDVPLVRPATVERMQSLHRDGDCAVSLLSVDLRDPSGYGRIVRDSTGGVSRIIEERDADEHVKKITEINGGAYVFDSKFLFDSLGKVNPENAQKEYYLPDLVGMARSAGRSVAAYRIYDENELMGVNRPEDVAVIESLLSGKIGA